MGIDALYAVMQDIPSTLTIDPLSLNNRSYCIFHIIVL